VWLLPPARGVDRTISQSGVSTPAEVEGDILPAQGSLEQNQVPSPAVDGPHATTGGVASTLAGLPQEEEHRVWLILSGWIPYLSMSPSHLKRLMVIPCLIVISGPGGGNIGGTDSRHGTSGCSEINASMRKLFSSTKLQVRISQVIMRAAWRVFLCMTMCLICCLLKWKR
jgi:hypothetical protein